MSRRRRLLRLVLALLAAAVLLVVLVVGGLRTRWARDALLARVGVAAQAFGLRVEARDLAVRPERGVFVFEEPRLYRLGEDGAPPFLVATRLVGRLDLGALAARRLAIESLELVEPVWELGAPGPAARERERSGEGGGGVEIGSVTVRDGAVRSAPDAFRPEAWLRSWRIEGADLAGVFGPDALVADLRGATLEAERRDGGLVRLAVEADARWPEDGPLAVERLVARGRGLDLEARATIGDAPDGPFAVAFRLDADAALLAPGVEPAGTLAAEGDLDLRRWNGAVTLAADDFPVRVLRPFVGPETLARLGAVGSVLDARGRVDLGEETPVPVDVD